MTYRNHAEEIADLRAELAAEREDRALQYDRLPRVANLRNPKPDNSGAMVVAVIFVCIVLAAIVGFSAVFAAETMPVDLMKCLETKGDCYE